MSLTSSIPVLRVSDYQAARAFWVDVLGFRVNGEAGDPVVGFGMFCRDRAEVFLIAWDGPEAAYEGWRAFYHTDDLAGIAQALDKAGYEYKGPTRTPYGMDEIEVTDPSGNVVCFGQIP